MKSHAEAPLPLLARAAATFSIAAALALPDGLAAAAGALLALRGGLALLPFALAGHVVVAAPRWAATSPSREPVPVALTLDVRVTTATRVGAWGRHASAIELEDADVRALARAPSGLLLEPGTAPPRSRGERLRVQGRLTPAAAPRNPGVLRERALLRADRVEPAPAPGFLRAPAQTVRSALDRLANRIDATLASRLSPRAAALASGLAIGRGDRLDEELRDGLRAIGAWHFVAVSGSHVALVAALAGFVLGWLRWDERLRSVLVVVLVLAYAGLAGGEAPALRAVIAACGAALVFGRRLPATIPWLAAALLALVAFTPQAASEPGLQLSFLAVLALGVAARHGPLRSPKGTGTGIDLAAPVWRAGRFAVAAAIATSPATAFHFGSVAVLAPVATLLLGPLIAVALTIALLAAASCALPAWTTLPLGALLDGVDGVLRAAAAAGDRLPATPLLAIAPSRVELVLHALVWLALLVRRAGIAVAIAAALCVVALPRGERGPAITLLAVGHGQALLVRGAERADLVDAGGEAIGAASLVRALVELDVTRLDALVLSHLDHDHAGHAPHVLAALPVGEIVLPATAREELERGGSPLARALARAAADRRVPVRFVAAGERIGPHECLWPPPGRSFAERNAGSLALRLTSPGPVALTTGDLEGFPLLELAASLDRPADLLVLPHHGGADPGLPALLERADPRLVLISREERPPPAATLDALRASARPWLSTGKGGAIGLALPEDGARGGPAIARGSTCR